MASRTNKRWIAQKKAKQKKQAGRLKGLKKFEYPKRKLDLNEAKERGIIGVHVNPKWNSYHWFSKWRKVCRETRLRVDPDGYRMIRTPSGGTQIVPVAASGWVQKQLRRAASAA